MAIQSRTYRVVILLIPNGTVQELALEVMQTWNTRPLPIVQGAGSLDKDVTLVTLNRTTIHISDLISPALTLFQIADKLLAYLYFPSGTVFIPRCF